MCAVTPGRRWRLRCLSVGLVCLNHTVVGLFLLAGTIPVCSAETLPGLSYTNYQVPEVPWSIHIVQVDRTRPEYELHSWHAGGKALGLSTLSRQLALVPAQLGHPLAAVNGDFYQRDHAYAGDPRGLQIVESEVFSAPGGTTFWLDQLGQPHLTNVVSQFQITWPDGTVTPFGLNEDRHYDEIVLYTPAVGASTRTSGGRELVLEGQDRSPWPPLRMGHIYLARVKEVREQGNSPLLANTMVLSLGPALRSLSKQIAPGALLRIGTGSVPNLRGAKTAIGGGPMLLADGTKQKFRAVSGAWEYRSRAERHPRAAVGWNDKSFFLVEVDGRQSDLSVGMTLDELTSFLLKLGCTDAMNLDGGGSATLWFDGEVRNSPCEGRERDLANSLVLVRKPSLGEKATASNRE